MNRICAECSYRSCVDVGSWNFNAQTFLEGMTPANPYNYAGQGIMLLIQRPSNEDIRAGTHLSSGAGQWLKEIVDPMGVPYTVDCALRCLEWNTKPTPKSYNTCGAHWRRTVSEMRPKVIIAFGLEAGKQATGLFNLTLPKLREGVWDYPHDNHTRAKVIVTDLHTTHSAFCPASKGGKDLRREYARVFRLAHNIVTGKYIEEEVSFELCDNPDHMQKHIREIRESALHKEVSLDCETANRHPVIWHPKNEIITKGVGFKHMTTQAYHQHVFYIRDWAMKFRKKLVESLYPGLTAVGTNIKYDVQSVYRFCETDLRALLEGIQDTMYLKYIPDQSKWGNGLESQGSELLGITPYKSKTSAEFDFIKTLMKPVLKTPKNTYNERVCESLQAQLAYFGSMDRIPQKGELLHYGHLSKDFVVKYQAKDLWVQSRVWHEHFRQALANYPVNLKMIYKLMIRATWALMQIERNGLPIDIKAMKAVQEACEKDIVRIQAWIDNHPYVRQAGLPELNIKSINQIARVVESSGTYCRFVSAKTQLPCMDKTELKEQAGKSDYRNKTPRQKFWWAVGELRKKRDKISKFIRPYVNFGLDGLVRPTFSLTRSEGSSGFADNKEDGGGIESGRIASKDPSTHLIIHDYEIRSCFPAITPPDRPSGEMWVLLEEDFSGAESVVLGVLTMCKGYIEVFQKKWDDPTAWDGDIYQVIATRFWRVKNPTAFWERDDRGDLINEAAKAMRKLAKILVLGEAYLRSPKSTAQANKIPVEEAEAFNAWFWAAHPEIRMAVAKVINDVCLGKMIVTPSGRQSTFDIQGDYNYNIEEHWEVPFHELVELLDISFSDGHAFRKAWNFKIQSTTSDMCIAQMVRIDELIYTRGWSSWIRMVNTVHDSLWFMVRYDMIRKAHNMVKTIMEDPTIYKKYKMKVAFPDPKVRKYLMVDGKSGPSLGSMRGMR